MALGKTKDADVLESRTAWSPASWPSGFIGASSGSGAGRNLRPGRRPC